MCSIQPAVCTSFARQFIGGSVGVQHSLCDLCKLCKAFYRWQCGCAAFSLRSVQALHGILRSVQALHGIL